MSIPPSLESVLRDINQLAKDRGEVMNTKSKYRHGELIHPSDAFDKENWYHCEKCHGAHAKDWEMCSGLRRAWTRDDTTFLPGTPPEVSLPLGTTPAGAASDGEPIDLTTMLAERGKRYGTFAERAQIAQVLKHLMFEAPNWQLLASDQREALETIAGKISRILNGDPNYADSWDDIAGYAKLVGDRLAGRKEL